MKPQPQVKSGPAEVQMPFERALELTEEEAAAPTDPSRDWAKDPLGSAPGKYNGISYVCTMGFGAIPIM